MKTDRAIGNDKREWYPFFLERTFKGYIEDNGSAYVVYDGENNAVCHLWKTALEDQDVKLIPFTN